MRCGLVLLVKYYRNYKVSPLRQFIVSYNIIASLFAEPSDICCTDPSDQLIRQCLLVPFTEEEVGT